MKRTDRKRLAASFVPAARYISSTHYCILVKEKKTNGGIREWMRIKRERYEKIASELVRLAGGRDNILGIAHCATRLRLVLGDNDRADMKGIEDVDLVKGVFVAGDQLQIIFGAGLVNDSSLRKKSRK